MEITWILFCSIIIILSESSVTLVRSQKNGPVKKFVELEPWKYMCKNGNDLDSKLLDAKDKLVLIEFTTYRDSKCRSMKTFVDDLDKKYPDLIILRVEVYECIGGTGNSQKFKMCYQYFDCTQTPTYIFRKLNRDVHKISLDIKKKGETEEGRTKELQAKISEYLQNNFPTARTPNSEPSPCQNGICPIPGSPLPLTSSVKQNEGEKDKAIQLTGVDENKSNKEVLNDLQKHIPGTKTNSIVVKPTSENPPTITSKEPSPCQNGICTIPVSPLPLTSSIKQNAGEKDKAIQPTSADENKLNKELLNDLQKDFPEINMNSIVVKPTSENPPTITAKEPSPCQNGMCPIPGSPLPLTSSVKQNAGEKEKPIQLSGADENISNEELLNEIQNLFPGIDMNSIVVTPTGKNPKTITAKSFATRTPSLSQNNGPNSVSSSPSFSSVKPNADTGDYSYLVQNVAELEQKINEAGDKLVIIEFYSDYCTGCKIMKPFFEEVASNNPDIVTLKMCLDEEGVIKSLKNEYDLKSKPTFVFKKMNTEIARVTGDRMAQFNKILSQYRKNNLPNAGDTENPALIKAKSFSTLTPISSQKDGPTRLPSFSSFKPNAAEPRLPDGEIDKVEPTF